MSAAPCAICGVQPAERQGEHVWPKWQLKLRDLDGPPTEPWRSNGNLIRNRHGLPVHPDRRQRILLPVCRGCNQTMNKRFEEPARALLTRLISSHWSGAATSDEWKTVGRWFAKTLSLLGNPRARYDEVLIHEKAARFGWGHPDYSWLHDADGITPEGLSLYVFRTEDRERGQAQHRMPVPARVVQDDGHVEDFHLLIHVEDGLCATLLNHPGWAVEHPLVEAGSAWELLHGAPGNGATLDTLPALPWNTIIWTGREAALKPGLRLGAALPPLREADGLLPASIETLTMKAHPDHGAEHRAARLAASGSERR